MDILTTFVENTEDTRTGYKRVGAVYLGENMNKYYVYNIHFYNDDGIVLSIDLENDLRNLSYLMDFHVFHETKRKMKFKLDKTNFIFKNEKLSYYNTPKYDLYVYIDDLNTVEYQGKYISRDNHILFKRYLLLGKYVYNKKIKSFMPMIERNQKKIVKELHLINYEHGYVYRNGMEQQYLKKHMDNILKYNRRIQNTIMRMSESDTYNTIEVYD